MIEEIKLAAEEVGINAFITNSNERIETQLNRLTKEEELPIMLVSWDINVTLQFDNSGFLQNPSADIVALLVTKPEDMTKDEAEKSAEEMGLLFTQFLQKLNSSLSVYQKQAEQPIGGASYKMVPVHGAGKHSGVLGKWNMKTAVVNCEV